MINLKIVITSAKEVLRPSTCICLFVHKLTFFKKHLKINILCL